MMREEITINGKRYRVAANWNAIRDYCRRTGVTDLNEIGNVLWLGLDGVLTMAHCCLKEGERLDGRELEVSEEELGAVMGPVEMAGFVQVYVRQTTAGLPGTTETGDESKKK